MFKTTIFTVTNLVIDIKSREPCAVTSFLFLYMNVTQLLSPGCQMTLFPNGEQQSDEMTWPFPVFLGGSNCLVFFNRPSSLEPDEPESSQQSDHFPA